MIKEATAALIDHKDLTYEQANAVVNEIMNGETSQVQTAAFLAAPVRKRRDHRGDQRMRRCHAGTRTSGRL